MSTTLSITTKLTVIFFRALNDPTEFLQPIVDLLASKYGWAVSLLMTGPMPTENPSGPDPIRVVR